MTERSPERAQFLADLLVTAIEHSGYGFPELRGPYVHDGPPESWHAVIGNRYGDGDAGNEDGVTEWDVTVDTMAHGIGVMRAKRLGGKAFWLADRTNADDGDFDVLDALAVLECALFGEVVYA
jgi:hypothetical protein